MPDHCSHLHTPLEGSAVQYSQIVLCTGPNPDPMQDVAAAAAAGDASLAEQIQQAREQALQKRLDQGLILARLEDPGVGESSSAAAYLRQQSGLVSMARSAAHDLQLQTAESAT